MNFYKKVDITKLCPIKSVESYFVVEWCSHCESEIEMKWDIDNMGYKAFCPVCGEQLMLCDECMHENGDCDCNLCDYDETTGVCKHSIG